MLKHIDTQNTQTYILRKREGQRREVQYMCISYTYICLYVRALIYDIISFNIVEVYDDI